MICVTCGANFERKSHKGPTPKYCTSCVADRARVRSATHEQTRTRVSRVSLDWIDCPQCGERYEWMSRPGRRPVVCLTCYPEYRRKQVAKLRSDWRMRNLERDAETTKRWRDANPTVHQTNNARRRLGTRGARVEAVEIQVLRDRDGDSCQICMTEIDFNLVWGASSRRWYRSIDHVQPISLGGQHTYDNTRLAHLGCNSSRGNRVNR